jgi:hypothetical protein
MTASGLFVDRSEEQQATVNEVSPVVGFSEQLEQQDGVCLGTATRHGCSTG